MGEETGGGNGWMHWGGVRGVRTLSVLRVPENGKCSFIPMVNRGPMKPCEADFGLCLV